MHPGTVRQTQWFDSFNRDRRCDRPGKKVGDFHFLCLVQVARIYVAVEETPLGFVLASKRVPSARKKQFFKTYGPFLC